MGAGKPDEAYGVREFKARFGGEQVEYGRFLKINNHILYNIGKIALKCWKLFKS
jgi:lipid II:glycine glycyltransferase (peptidoglycan interpeptide bridge formation enzyme)